MPQQNKIPFEKKLNRAWRDMKNRVREKVREIASVFNPAALLTPPLIPIPRAPDRRRRR
jgi:hypothetical protein